MNNENNVSSEMHSTVNNLLQQAYSKYQSADYVTADTLCREALSLQPENAHALLMLGMVNINRNLLEDAKRILADAAKYAPDKPGFLQQLAPGLSHVGLFDEAANCWEKLSSLDPENEQLVSNYGSALYMGDRLVEAAEAFKKAISIKPGSIGAHLNLGMTNQKLGRTQAAESSFNMILDLVPRHEMASAQLGGLLQLEGRVDEAIAIYNEALQESPASADLLFGLYGASFETEGADKAVALLDKAVGNNPDHFQARSSLGVMLAYKGQIDASESHFKNVKTHTPEYSFIIDSWQYAKDYITAGAQLFTLSNSGLAYAVEKTQIEGLFLEFGVWQGRSINFISSCTDNVVHGFDSFEGIPDEWEGMPSGSYSTFGELPEVNDNVVLYRGWFDESLPGFLESNKGPVAFMNIDCDTYQSTKIIFDYLAERIVDGTVIVFDEYFCYPNWKDHEYKAFQEYLKTSGYSYEYLFFNFYTRQAGIAIKSTS